MNNNVYNPYNNDPNKTKKCNCEDKHGPKPFTSNNNQSVKNKPN